MNTAGESNLLPFQREVEAVAFESDKVMFEIYREPYQGRYKVVYFTELQDHNKEFEISRAMAGDHFFDGFIRNYQKDEAKKTINQLLERLNSGESLDPSEIESALKPFIPA